MKFKIIVLLSLFVVSNSHTIDHSFIEQLATISDDTPEAPKLEMQVELAKDEAIEYMKEAVTEPCEE